MSSPSKNVEILLVEDSVTDALLIGEALTDVTEFAPRVVNAELLSASLELAKHAHFDVVLLDLGLPDAHGLDTFRRFHRQVPDVPVLVLTGLDDLSVGLQAIQEGAQDYLLKKRVETPLLSRAIRYAMERHRVAAALSASEERFQLAVSGASAGLWDWNPKTGAMYLSPHFKKIMGYEDHELPDEITGHRESIHPDDLARVIDALKAHLEHRDTYDVEYRVRTRSGDFRWIQSRGQALWNSAGEPYRMVGWIMDVTDRKRDEDALRVSREELRRLSAHIQSIREEEKTRIARELHDDLGQQLTALKMAVTLVDNELKEAGWTSRTSRLPNVYALIGQLLDSVRRIAADLRPVMLDDLGLLAAIEWLTHEFAARYRIPVTSRIEADDIAFNRDSATEVFRIVQEALTNVARHSAATEVTLDIVRDEPNCVVRIADNGRGTARDTRPNRHSLGLLGMRERAARLGGEIRIDTAPGRGFALTATLPLAVIEAADSA
ncbi:PAS domain-containing protein [Burkholderia humptydooensis]|uniref:PAS domain-containing protein n=2 Tax=Burkholderia humptydooensis TaxID=430531 RepID=A0A7U4SV75_9BURK|nr:MULTISPECIES: PAS domain-containing protein [Burkholderia]AJY39176.1 response regulator [Burkholderia sp. 2002721687]ALX45512.1 histidine kinase [Burkholderia humptydooensis]EIP85282.1 response regulator/sensory box histidine kinase [Burkholderia humptydooensis MSMB43]QPS46985.1 PAS domain-containing protein [Burkholderia humptydooensis]